MNHPNIFFRHLFLLLLVLVICTAVGRAQNDNTPNGGDPTPRERVQNRVEAQRIAYITNRLQLTPEEAQQFWPLYNQFVQQRNAIRAQNAGMPNLKGGVDNLTDADIEKVMLAEMDKQGKELELRKEYFQKLRKVLSIRKIFKLYRSEKDFNSEILKELRNRINERRQNRQNSPPPPPKPNGN
jgi:hypothetical protein